MLLACAAQSRGLLHSSTLAPFASPDNEPTSAMPLAFKPSSVKLVSADSGLGSAMLLPDSWRVVSAVNPARAHSHEPEDSTERVGGPQ